ncbi:AAA family ATPase [Acidithiobacillus sp. MC6.1]|nr:AAA family ATPase [Acidithiobacillus sp. MC6.1]
MRTTLPLAIFTVGTSASGKSTWARAMQAEHPLLNIMIIERDAIRQNLHRSTAQSPFSWGAWDRSLEDTVQRLWEEQIMDALAGCSPCRVPTPCESPVVIISDTNLDAGSLLERARWLAGLGVKDMTIRYFPARPLIELIRMDQQRPYPVGASVLREQLRKIQPEEAYWGAVEAGLLGNN